MESLDELTKISSGKNNFFKHVFNFDDDSKSDMLNIIQYAVLGLIPVIIFNKLMQRYVPEADEEKGSPELLSEILAQTISMFLAILIIHRIITFIPTYSGEKYSELSVTNIILTVLIIILSLQTKLGEKVSILVERATDIWEGRSGEKKKNSVVKVSQPISQNQMSTKNTLSSSGTTSISNLPALEQQMQQQGQNYDGMYRQDSTPLVNASSPVVESFEPSAANEGGGGGFGSAFGGGW